MTKHEYLMALEKALKSNRVNDSADIVEEYAEHFDMKTADGYSEEEISTRLGSPEEIANEYKGDVSEDGIVKRVSVVNRLFNGIGIIMVDVMFIGPMVLMLYSFLLTFGAFAITALSIGVTYVLGFGQFTNESVHIRLLPMPYISALLTGITLIALGILLFIGTVYCVKFLNQMVRKLARWHRNELGTGPALPPIPLNPQIKPTRRRAMRTVVLISIVVFIIGLILAVVSMMLISQSFEPWHTWEWFV